MRIKVLKYKGLFIVLEIRGEKIKVIDVCLAGQYTPKMLNDILKCMKG